MVYKIVENGSGPILPVCQKLINPAGIKNIFLINLKNIKMGKTSGKL
jgi:hypothetical protein